MTEVLVDPTVLRAEVQKKYREVALEPGAQFHFHTGRGLAARLGMVHNRAFSGERRER